MALSCEVCGSPIRNVPNRISIDGAVLQVCQNCVGHGTPLAPPAPKLRMPRARPVPREVFAEPELEVDPDYNTIVRQAREKMGLTQEALGRAINVKSSVISHVESKRMQPDLILARTLMHYLKVNILVPSSELENSR
jgi:putative transcription factor